MKVKDFIKTVFLLAALLGGICNPVQASAYTVTPVTEAPDWQVDWTYNQSRPDWQAPSATDFSGFMVMFIKIEETLQPYASKDDLLAIFVDGEMRGVASPAYVVGSEDTAPTTFVLKAFSNESNGDIINVSPKYYSAKLNHIFDCSYTSTYDEDEAVGITEDFIPPFTLGSSKYPVVNTLDVAHFLSMSGIEPDEGDMVAAFVGDECRGVSELTTPNSQPSTLNPHLSTLNSQPSTLTVYGREPGESFTLKYYDAYGNCVLTFIVGKLPIGDANGDGSIDVADISYVIIAMSSNNGDTDISDADVNMDGVVDVADIATIIREMAAKSRLQNVTEE